MGNEIMTTDSPLWAGWNGEQRKGDDSANYKYGYESAVDYYRRTNGRLYNQKLLVPPLLQNVSAPIPQPAILPAQPATDALSAVKNFVTANPILTLGGAALIVYLIFFSQGGGIAERSIVTRYSKK